MQSASLNFPFQATALLADAASSNLEQTKKDFGTKDSQMLHTSRGSVVPTLENTVACTFIIPSRSRPSRKIVKVTQAPASTEQGTEPHMQSPSPPAALSQNEIIDNSTHTVAFQDQTIGMSESSSSGTFGAFPIWENTETITVSSPKSGRFRRVQSFPQRSPLTQLFVPPRFSTPMVESFSDSSADGTTLLTPVEGPFLSDLGRAGDGTGELSTSDTRASLFTISAYSRTDNLKTPVVCSELGIPEIVKPFSEPTRRVSFINLDHAAPNMVDNHRIAIIPSASMSTLRRPHRPSPLALEQEDVALSHPMVARNVSQTNENSAGHTDSGHSSAVEETPVHRVVRRGARYTQPSALPSLPIVEFVKRVCVELRIDQEEHRTIRPQFTFKRHIAKPTGRLRTGVLRPSTALKSSEAFWENVTANGLVDMRMPAKEIGTFHCGTISREAILRRVVVDGEDHRDHLSANVVLPLKENGVYTVHGVERERKKTEPKILVWKFEYTVEDKRLSQTGELISGEKLLRPISFICSPELLLPSQGSGVTIMHLLSKKFTACPTAKRIPPPAMPSSHPVSATSAASEYSFNMDTVHSSSRRRSRIGTAVKALSRPTTPATDHRLRDEVDGGRPSFSFSRRPSVARSYKSEVKGGDWPGTAGEHPRSLSQPTSRHPSSHKHAFAVNFPQIPVSQEPHSYHWPHKWAATLGKSVDSLPLASAVPQRPYTTESPPQRPHTAGFAFGKSLKYMSGAIAGKMASINRPATAGSQPSGTPSGFSRPKRSSFHIILHSPADSRKREIDLSSNIDDSDASVHQPPWRMPTKEEMDGTLLNARRFIEEQQQRLEILARSRSSRNTSIEGLDSSGDVSLQSSQSSGPPQKPRYHFTAQPIASPRTLQSWARPGISTNRPSTANGVLSEDSLDHPLTNRSSSFATLRRPHTSDGPNQEALFPSRFSRSRNGSTTSLGLPHPPRKPRTPLRNAS